MTDTEQAQYDFLLQSIGTLYVSNVAQRKQIETLVALLRKKGEEVSANGDQPAPASPL